MNESKEITCGGGPEEEIEDVSLSDLLSDDDSIPTSPDDPDYSCLIYPRFLRPNDNSAD